MPRSKRFFQFSVGIMQWIINTKWCPFICKFSYYKFHVCKKTINR